jgi:Kef-type K+ transport system membrane component KefB
VIVLSLVLAKGRAPLQSGIMLAFALGAFAAVLFAARAREGYFAGIIARTMGSSGQLPMRLAICVLILLIVLSRQLEIDMVLGAFVAGAIVRAALVKEHRNDIAVRLDGIGSAFLVPIFFITSGARLDVASLFSNPLALALVPVYTLLMLMVRGIPALMLYRDVLTRGQRIALAFHLSTQISLVVPITGIAVKRGFMPGAQGAAIVGGAILTTLLFPALARRFVQAAK